MKPILLTIAGNPENQDRGLIVQDGPNLVLCVADGAGGRSGGAEAASMVVKLVRETGTRLQTADSCAELLRQIDGAIARDRIAGETTCALAVVTGTGIFGASVGDSGIWFIPESGLHSDLTRGQQRKPFIGSGGAWPIQFQFRSRGGLLVLATDGLLKYTSADRIVETCRKHSLESAAPQLIELVRYSSGALPDDVTLILAKI